jgi:phosphopantetheine--protein transferase-like protein
MALRVGCDIVSIGEFRKRLQESGGLLLERLFHPGESAGAGPERLAGLFAAKEAALKSLGLPAGAWLQLCIDHDRSGAPLLRLLEQDSRIKEISVSISHNNDTAIAIVAAIIE